MSGKIIGIVIVLSSIIAGAALYYLQIYGFYEEVETAEVQLVSVVSDEPEPIPFADFQAIDADSSPIRYRACFTTEMSLALLTETYVGLEQATPRNAPGWFDCFDAEAIASELDAGTALPFLGQKNVDFGVDRIVAITEDGRGYVWHELNDCGDKAYDGTIVGEECPDRDQITQ
ncbi:hypothetical protein GCM10007385_24060 [Tateyamaria omphalii]|uniref:DUF6446 family protein n=1 Tax=Tateyamaria omphalii TaxID=299262 RepID=UPI0016780C06|nr:DUF6446 family protein [Tateyamaria omphalii]GGX54885.1 hypothetical protein GCM10007385_24060 [Tateyamaria omphalii]